MPQLLQAFSSMRGIKMMENDYELIYMAQEKNEIAIEYLVNKYKYIIALVIGKNLGKMKVLRIDSADVYNLGLLSLHRAIDQFNAMDGIAFSSFATILINRSINNYFKSLNRKKDSIFLNSISIETEYENIMLDESFEPSKIVELEQFKEYKVQIIDALTDLEKSIYNLMSDFNSSEIAKILNISIKQVYNAKTRIKNKVQKMLELNSKFP